MKRMNVLALAGLASAFALSAQADAAPPWSLQSALGEASALRLSGTFRARYESLDGQFRPNRGNHDQAWSLRSTLLAEYRAPWFRLSAEANDSRVYGDDADSTVSTNEVNALELVQAHIGSTLGALPLVDGSLAVKAGRWTLDLGSRRLVARNDFRNTTNAFTGLHLDWKDAGQRRVQLFWSLPIRRLPDGSGALRDNDLQTDEEDLNLVFWGGQIESPVPVLAAQLSVYGLVLDEDDAAGRTSRNRSLTTTGGRLFRAPTRGHWDYEVEGAYQFGTAANTAAATSPVVDVSAFFAHALAGYTFAQAWQPRLGIAYDHASGDDPASGSNNRFDTLFGARRWEYGPTGIYGPIGRSNLSSVDTRIEVRPTARWEALLGYRANWLDAATDSFSSTGVRDATGASGSFAGHQIESRLRYWLVPARVRLEAGGALFINGRFLDDAPNASGHGNPLYGYTLINTTF